MTIADNFFSKSGKTDQDIQAMADKIMAADPETKKSEIQKLGQNINRALGMMPAKKEDYSTERSLVDSEMKSFHLNGMLWSMTPNFSQDELVTWLKRYFAYMAYIAHFGLDTEAIRNNFRTPEENKKPKH